MEGVSDNLILEMAKRIEDTTKFITLAVKLGFTIEEAERFYTMNRMNGRVSTDGTRRMLCRWRENTPAKKQWATLEAALIDADLAGIADEFSSMVEGRASKVPRSSVEIRSKPIRGAPDPDGDEEEPELLLLRAQAQVLRVQAQAQVLRVQARAQALLQDADNTILTSEEVFEFQQHIQHIQHIRRIINESLEERYTDPARFADGILLQKQDFQPVLKRMDSSSESLCSMENSRHEIFSSPMATKLPRRITVSGSNTAKLTALIRSLLYDWATENRASDFLLQQQHLFELRANDMKPNQTIESAIKNQLFPDLDEVDEALIRQMLKDMPDAITILLHGLNGKNCGKNIMDVLSGRTLQEVTVMVTTRPRFANMLHRMSPGLYDRIEMH